MKTPTFACRNKLEPVWLGKYDKSGANWNFQPRAPAKLAHAGLILDKLLPGHDDESQAKKQTLRNAQLAARRAAQTATNPAGVYAAAFTRRQTEFREPSIEDFPLEVQSGTRLVVGLGGASPLETGLRVHHTYGVPFIPGSALKGLAAHYCDQVVAAEQGNVELQRVVEIAEDGKTKRRTGQAYELLFGNSEDAGFIVFHDAWIDPETLGHKDEGLLLDVMTPHHGDYYSNKRYACPDHPLNAQLIPPTDFDDPVPVQFLSVRGKFHFALSWNDGFPVKSDDEREQRTSWLGIAKTLLIDALYDWGVGGKTSSGYGRLVDPALRDAVAQDSARSGSAAGPAMSSQPKAPRYNRGDQITVTCLEPAAGKKKAKFRADDGFSGHISSESQPAVEREQTLQLWVANVSSQGYTFSASEPVVKRQGSKGSRSNRNNRN